MTCLGLFSSDEVSVVSWPSPRGLRARDAGRVPAGAFAYAAAGRNYLHAAVSPAAAAVLAPSLAISFHRTARWRHFAPLHYPLPPPPRLVFIATPSTRLSSDSLPSFTEFPWWWWGRVSRTRCLVVGGRRRRNRLRPHHHRRH